MPELFAGLFISVDGSALGTRSPGHLGYVGPDLERWIGDEQERPHRDVRGRKTYEVLAGFPRSSATRAGRSRRSSLSCCSPAR